MGSGLSEELSGPGGHGVTGWGQGPGPWVWGSRSRRPQDRPRAPASGTVGSKRLWLTPSLLWQFVCAAQADRPKSSREPRRPCPCSAPACLALTCPKTRGQQANRDGRRPGARLHAEPGPCWVCPRRAGAGAPRDPVRPCPRPHRPHVCLWKAQGFLTGSATDPFHPQTHGFPTKSVSCRTVPSNDQVTTRCSEGTGTDFRKRAESSIVAEETRKLGFLEGAARPRPWLWGVVSKLKTGFCFVSKTQVRQKDLISVCHNLDDQHRIRC